MSVITRPTLARLDCEINISENVEPNMPQVPVGPLGGARRVDPYMDRRLAVNRVALVAIIERRKVGVDILSWLLLLLPLFWVGRKF